LISLSNNNSEPSRNKELFTIAIKLGQPFKNELKAKEAQESKSDEFPDINNLIDQLS
jgi:hypothetical protein